MRVPRKAVEHLLRADPIMAGLVERLGRLEYNVEPDPWRGIVGSVVGQQLSVAAAATIRARVAALGDDGFPTPEFLLSTPDEALRGCGLSRAKTSYIKDISARWAAGEFPARQLETLPDEEVIEALTKLRGVGRWTAEMVLIFSLRRPDVLAVDDLGIRAAVQKGYGLETLPSRSELLRQGEPWRPYRSYASLYLWRSLAST